jgi:hypothetical protein
MITFAKGHGLDGPWGLAVREGVLFVASFTTDTIHRYVYFSMPCSDGVWETVVAADRVRVRVKVRVRVRVRGTRRVGNSRLCCG